MATRTFEFEYTIYGKIEVDDAVIDAVDDEWRSQFYDLEAPTEIADHISRNLIKGCSLSDLDGWADQPNSNAKLTIDDTQMEIEEE